jgi:hypothetical protein
MQFSSVGSDPVFFVYGVAGSQEIVTYKEGGGVVQTVLCDSGAPAWPRPSCQTMHQGPVATFFKPAVHLRSTSQNAELLP